jgi:uncharacterized membrane protein YraQ (UPF0718 family)
LKKLLKRYRFFIVLALINIVLGLLYPSIGYKSTEITANNLKEMLSVIPPIFILLGLLDVWVQKETMMKYMGEGSGFIGVLIAFLLGSAAAGPLYTAFPVAGVLLKKGTKLSNALIFIGAWSTTKIPLLLFEAASLGWKFTALRFSINIFGIAAIAYITEKVLSKDDRKLIYNKAMNN